MVYLFGDCRVDFESRAVERDDRPVHLPPKALELLRVLLEARPRVVTKSQLMDRLWPETYVAEGNLSVLVGEVRAAIGDGSRASRFIRTHHTQGYSFVGEVNVLRMSREAASGLPPMLLMVGRRRIVLPAGESSIGRDALDDIRIDDLSVSKRHASIHASQACAVIRDLGSKNGTLLNGVRVTGAVELKNGARIRFGNVDAVFEIVESATASTVTADVDDSLR